MAIHTRISPLRSALRALVPLLFLFSSCTPAKDCLTLFTGTYTDAGSEGIYVHRFDQRRGIFLPEKPLSSAKLENPSYLALSEEDILYSVSETQASTSALVSYRFDPESFSLTETSRVSSRGADPCHISTNGSVVAASNYSGGTMSIFPLGSGGEILDEPVVVEGSAGGPDSLRQRTPHVHCAVFTPDGKYLIASDFSADRLIRYEISSGKTVTFPVRPDTGPRHIVFAPDGKHLYVIGELSCEVGVFEYSEGNLTEKQFVLADNAGGRGGADLHISPDGRFLYASLRLKNEGIAVFSIAPDGSLYKVGHTPTGSHPRNFCLTPNGRFLLCACRDSDCIEVYSVDRSAGTLAKTSETLSLSKPVCLVWGR